MMLLLLKTTRLKNCPVMSDMNLLIIRHHTSKEMCITKSVGYFVTINVWHIYICLSVDVFQWWCNMLNHAKYIFDVVVYSETKKFV